MRQRSKRSGEDVFEYGVVREGIAVHYKEMTLRNGQASAAHRSLARSSPTC